ncbi:MAG: hypothetical protein FJ014_02965 [Chloroflexi bacterium]|nr:hypothetical protein [Chloroflexota bacterium]
MQARACFEPCKADLRPHSSEFSQVLMWQVKDEGKAGWRAFLENAHTGQRKGFASLDALFAFLQQQTNDDVKEET